MREVNAKMNATPTMDNFFRKRIFLGEVAKVGDGCLVQVSLLSKDMAKINKIANSIEDDGI